MRAVGDDRVDLRALLEHSNPGLREAAILTSVMELLAARNPSGLFLIGLASFALIISAREENAQAFKPPRPGEATTRALHVVRDRSIWPQMGLDDALQTFERMYRTPDSFEQLHELNLRSSQNLIMDLAVLSAKLLADTKQSRENISLSPYIYPVPLSPLKLRRWKKILRPGIKPPEVSHQTFSVTLNGKAYVIAPGHGTREDKRYFTPPKSDTSVRFATEEEARFALPLDRKPSNLPGTIVTLEGKLLTGQIVRFQSAAMRGRELLQALLPDMRASFHNWNRGVEVGYEKTIILILPQEWSHLKRLRLYQAAGLSGAPAIERTPQGDAVLGHLIGHHTIEVDGTKITLGILVDYDTIRSVVDKFAAFNARAPGRTGGSE